MQQKDWVQISPEYGTCGLWMHSGPASNADDLPVSDGLRARIDAWGIWWNQSEFYEDPEFRRPFDLDGYVMEGREIARAIKSELPGWVVRYHDYSKAVCACGDAVEEITLN